MRFCNLSHRFYCRVNLPARTMHLGILDHAGTIVLHKDVPAEGLPLSLPELSLFCAACT